MTTPIAPATAGTSTRPYLIRALHDWCTDNGFTPYIAVFVDDHVQVPKEYVKNNEIVLNVGFEATSGLKLGNDFIEFRARFGGKVALATRALHPFRQTWMFDSSPGARPDRASDSHETVAQLLAETVPPTTRAVRSRNSGDF